MSYPGWWCDVEHLTNGLLPPSRATNEGEEPTYKCPDCLDRAYVIREGTKKFKHSGVVRCMVAAWCDCHAGRAACAGYWFNQVYERVQNTRVHSDEGRRRLAEHLDDEPLRRRWLPDAIEALRLKYEAERRRKLSAIENERTSREGS
jgi:hypothetical protein